jgi:hypothetical protein
MRQRAGRITAAGLTEEVTFVPVEGSINDAIDDAYRTKYRGSRYLNPMISAGLGEHLGDHRRMDCAGAYRVYANAARRPGKQALRHYL